MRIFTLAVLMGLAYQANAVKANKPKAEPIYLNESGSKMSPTEAIVSSINGGRVFKCTEVEPKVSKSGTSISVHAKK